MSWPRLKNLRTFTEAVSRRKKTEDARQFTLFNRDSFCDFTNMESIWVFSQDICYTTLSDDPKTSPFIVLCTLKENTLVLERGLFMNENTHVYQRVAGWCQSRTQLATGTLKKPHRLFQSHCVGTRVKWMWFSRVQRRNACPCILIFSHCIVRGSGDKSEQCANFRVWGHDKW